MKEDRQPEVAEVMSFEHFPAESSHDDVTNYENSIASTPVTEDRNYAIAVAAATAPAAEAAVAAAQAAATVVRLAGHGRQTKEERAATLIQSYYRGYLLVRSEALLFLDHIKCALDAMLKGGSIKDSDDLSPLCFQAQFDPIFGESMTSRLQSEKPLHGENKHDQNLSTGAVKGKKSVMVPLLEQAGKSLEKRKRVSTESNRIDGKDATRENRLEVGGDINGYARDFALPTTPKGEASDRHRARQIWKRHVWVVLLLDTFVCAMLFVIWLWVCRGFKCMHS